MYQCIIVYHYKSFIINYFVLYWPRRTPPSLKPTTRQLTNYAHINLSMFNTIEPIVAADYRRPQREIGRPAAVPHRRRLCPLVCRCRGLACGTNRPKADFLPPRRTVYDYLFSPPALKNVIYHSLR